MKTEMKDKAALRSALNAARRAFSEDGATFRVAGAGAMTVDVSTGEAILHDDVARTALDLVRQHYAEARFALNAGRHGIEVTSRAVDRNGSIVMRCRKR